MSESRADREIRLIVPRRLGSGTANDVFAVSHDGPVLRDPRLMAAETFDLRRLNEQLTRSALAVTRPAVFPAVIPPADGIGPGVAVHAALTPLPAPGNPTEHDRQMETLIGLLGVLARESTDAAQMLLPYQQAVIGSLALLGPRHRGLDLENPVGNSHFAEARADAVRVAGAVRDFLGAAALRAVGLPGPRGLARRLPTEPQIAGPASPLVVAHGDPTLGNQMQDGDRRRLLNDFDLAYVAESRHAAAHTWAALRLRSEYEPSPARREQYLDQIPGAAEAEHAGLTAAYQGIEIDRSAYTDVARAALGSVPDKVAWRSLHRFNGRSVITPERFTAVMAPLRERFAAVAPPTLPLELLANQPHVVTEGGHPIVEGFTPLEASLLAVNAADEAASPTSPVPDAVRELHESYVRLVHQRLSTDPGISSLAEMVEHMRGTASHVTVADYAGEIVYRANMPGRTTHPTPQRRKTKEL